MLKVLVFSPQGNFFSALLLLNERRRPILRRKQTKMAIAMSVDDDHFEIITTCIEYFHVHDIVRLCASSKYLQHACTAQLRTGSKQLAHKLLLQTVTTSCTSTDISAAEHTLQTQYDTNVTRTISAVKWLLEMVGSEELLSQASPASAATATAIFNMPCVPPTMVEVLVKHGLVIRHSQLITAARSRAEGADIWVAAALRAAMPVSCTVPSVLQHCCYVLSLPETDLELEELDRLFELPEDLPANAIADLMHICVNATSYNSHGFAIWDQLCASPATRTLDNDIMLAVFNHAAEAGKCYEMNCLCRLPVIQQLDASGGADALHRLIASEQFINATLLSPVITLPAMQQLSTDVVHDLLTSATKARKPSLVRLFLKLPAAEQAGDGIADIRVVQHAPRNE